MILDLVPAGARKGTSVEQLAPIVVHAEGGDYEPSVARFLAEGDLGLIRG